jgi:hypothetical protein
LRPGERWADQEALIADYESAYHGFLDRLRARYGAGTFLVVSATRPFSDATTRIVRERNRRGDDRVRHFFFGDAALDLLGCDWHPSLSDHRTLANLLTEFVARLPLRW